MPNDKNDKKNQKSTAVQKKGTEAVRSRDRDRRAGGKARTSGTPEPEQRRIDPVPESTRFINQILPFVFIVTAVLLAAFFLLSSEDTRFLLRSSRLAIVHNAADPCESCALLAQIC